MSEIEGNNCLQRTISIKWQSKHGLLLCNKKITYLRVLTWSSSIGSESDPSSGLEKSSSSSENISTRSAPSSDTLCKKKISDDISQSYIRHSHCNQKSCTGNFPGDKKDI